jgi:hypothetical protein
MQLGFEKDKPNIDKVGAWNKKEMTESCDFRQNPHEGGCTRDIIYTGLQGKGQKERRTAIKSAANKLSTKIRKNPKKNQFGELPESLDR